MVGGLVGGVHGDRLHEASRGEHVVAHRRIHLVGRVRKPLGVGRLLPKRRDAPPVTGRLDHPELSRLGDGHPDPGDGHAGAGGDVIGHHLPRIHPIDVVGAEHGHVVGPLVVDQVEVLVDGVG